MSVLVEQQVSYEQGEGPALLAQAVPAGWLPVLVRAEDYVPVSTFIASREAQRQSVPSGGTASTRRAAAEDKIGLIPSAEHNPEAHLIAWPVEQLQQLADSTYLTGQRWAQAMDVVVAYPGRLLSSEQVAALTKMPIAAWRDAPRKLPQHLKAHYSVPGWPLYAVGGRSLGMDDQVYWGSSAEQAERWRQVRGGSSGGDA